MADVYVNALTTISNEPTNSDSIVCVNRNTNEGQIIDYNLLADKILNKLTSKTFSGLNTTSKLLVGAINEVGLDIYSVKSNLATIVNSTTTITAGTDISNTWTNLATITIPAGAWLLIGSTTFNGTNATLTLRFSHNTSYRSSGFCLGGSTGNVSTNVVGHVSSSNEATITIDGYGLNTPKIQSPLPYIRAFRLK